MIRIKKQISRYNQSFKKTDYHRIIVLKSILLSCDERQMELDRDNYDQHVAIEYRL